MRCFSKIQKEADEVFGNILTEVFQNEESIVEFTYKDAVVMGLIKNLINHSKSLYILLDNKHHTSVDAILRTIFENYVYLKFILEKNSLVRAKSYAYSNRISEYQMFDKLTEQTLKGKDMRNLLKVTLEEVTAMFEKKDSPERRSEIESLYLEEFGMKWLKQKWYNLDGETKNFKALCIKMGMEPEYEFIYSILSTEVHGKDAMKNLDVQEFFVILKDSHTKDSKLHISMASLYLMESVRVIYQHYDMKKKLRHFNTMLRIHRKY